MLEKQQQQQWHLKQMNRKIIFFFQNFCFSGNFFFFSEKDRFMAA